MNQGHQPLARRIVLSVVPTTLGLIMLLSFAHYWAAKRQLLEGVHVQLSILARQSAESLSSFLRQRERDALLAAEAPLLRDHLKYREYGLAQEAEAYRKEAAAYFARFARKDRTYLDISYLDKSGRVRLSALGAGTSAPALGLPAGLRVQPGEVFDDMVSPREGGPRLRYWTGVFSEEGRHLGWLVLDCDPERLREKLDATRVGREGRTLLVDAEGRAFLGAQPPSGTPLIEEAQVPGTRWRVRLMASSQEFLAPLRSVQRWTLVAMAFAAIILTLWLGLWSRRVTQPIAEMAEGTRHIAGGDLDFRFATPPITELRVLGEAFNDMARSLKERNHELEARIRELVALREMERAAVQRLEEETVLRSCLRGVCQGLDLDRSGLYWIHAEQGEIRGRYIHGSQPAGLTEEVFRSRRIPLGTEDILNAVIRNRAAVLVKDPSRAGPEVSQRYVLEAQTREFILAPVLGKDRVFGVISADCYASGRRLSETDVDGLTLFANAVGLAIENFSLFTNLAESEARYRSVLENSPVAILGVSGHEHFITTWNLGAERIFGWRAAEILGKPLRSLMPPGATGDFIRLMTEVVEKGSVREYPVGGQSKDGRPLDLSLSWGGALPGFWMNKEWTVVIRDVTESKKLQQQVIRSEKLSAVGQLISGIAHELNNPLQAVVGYSQLLSRDAKASMKQDLRLIVESAERCRKIIDNLLLFVRQGRATKRAVSVAQAVRASLDLLQYKLKKSQSVKVKVRLPKDLPKVEADFQQLQQVLMNLINNACDALSEIPGPREIAISAAAVGAGVRVEVADTGPGIPEDLQERIFEPFFSTKGEGAGTGLGLAICRQIVADHGGRMTVGNREGSGAVFSFELPTAAPGRRGEPRKVPAPRRIAADAILLVEDDAAVSGLMEKVLKRDARRVVTADSVKAAARKGAELAFDAVVADLHLGEGGGGLELYENWERLTGRPRPPFLFVTGDPMNLELERRVTPSGALFLYKPVDLVELRHALARLIAGGRLHA